MFLIEKINEDNRQRVIDVLKVDVIRHVFAIYDIQYEPEHTTMYAAFDNGSLKGYALVYTALEFPSVVIECEIDVAEKLIEYAPKSHFTMHAPPHLLPIISKRFPDAKYYVEKWMLVKKGEASLFKSKLVRRLRTNDDASKLALLLSSRENRPKRTVKKYVELIGKQAIYGVFVNDKLVSYAGSFIQLPQFWMIGGVYTHTKHRNKGYATFATSAVTEESLKKGKAAALFVRSDNYSAIKVYEKIGYKMIREKLWIDVRTGTNP